MALTRYAQVNGQAKRIRRIRQLTNAVYANEHSVITALVSFAPTGACVV